MGLFSSIKKGLSKAWGGIKKTVKTVARTVKKVSKKIAYATPLGKKLWDLSSKVGKGIMKGIGKISQKLGPVGMMALSFVLAPVMGPAIGALWSGFGAGAASMAASANMFVSALGNVGSGIFAAGNFVGGTLGALGNAVTEGAKNVMTGNFSAAAQSFATNVSSAFTGKAGMAAVNAGAAQAAAQAGTLVGQSPGVADIAIGPVEPSATGINLDSSLMPQDTFNPVDFSNVGSVDAFAADVGSQVAMTPIEGQVSKGLFGTANPMSITDTDAFIKYGKEGVAAIQPNTMNTTSSDFSEVVKRGQQVKDFLGGAGGEQETGYQPFVPKMIKAQGVGNVGNAQGQGSAGFSLLGGVQGLEESLRRSQQMMFG